MIETGDEIWLVLEEEHEPVRGIVYSRCVFSSGEEASAARFLIGTLAEFIHDRWKSLDFENCTDAVQALVQEATYLPSWLAEDRDLKWRSSPDGGKIIGDSARFIRKMVSLGGEVRYECYDSDKLVTVFIFQKVFIEQQGL